MKRLNTIGIWLMMAVMAISLVSATQNISYTNNMTAKIIAVFNDPNVGLINYSLSQPLPPNVTTVPGTQTRFIFSPSQPYVSNTLYNFSIYAQNMLWVPMLEPAYFKFMYDNQSPVLITLIPRPTPYLTNETVQFNLAYNEDIGGFSVKISSPSSIQMTEYNSSFTSIDRRLFRATLDMENGEHAMNITAYDLAGNVAKNTSTFLVHTKPTDIFLVKPKYSVASSTQTQVWVKTSFKSNCSYYNGVANITTPMSPMITVDEILHKLMNFYLSVNGTTSISVKCNDMFGNTTLKVFNLTVDTSQPVITSWIADPNPVRERRFDGKIATTLRVVTNVPAICKYDYTKSVFDDMEHFFDQETDNEYSFITNHAATIDDLNDNSTYNIRVRCINRAETATETKIITVEVGTGVGPSINILSPKEYMQPDFYVEIDTVKSSICGYGESPNSLSADCNFGSVGTRHSGCLKSLAPGTHTYYFSCDFPDLGIIGMTKNITFIVDDSAPPSPTINITEPTSPLSGYTPYNNKLRIGLNSTDNQSGIWGYNYIILKDDLAQTLVRNWTLIPATDLTNNAFYATGISLSNGSSYFVRAYALNRAGIQSPEPPTRSDSITVDTSLKPKIPPENLTCNDSIRNGDETDTDCGGSCPKCIIGKNCTSNLDCLSSACDGIKRICVANTTATEDPCANGVQDGNETDVDCGGNCPACGIGSLCIEDGDCVTNRCVNSSCIIPEDTCNNGMKDDIETDVDCGGACSPCALGMQCQYREDCSSGNCVEGVCREQTQIEVNVTCGNGICDSTETPDNCASDCKAKKSKLALILFIIGILILLGGIGYYVYITYVKKPTKELPKTTGVLPPMQFGAQRQQGTSQPKGGVPDTILEKKLAEQARKKDQMRSGIFEPFTKAPEELKKEPDIKKLPEREVPKLKTVSKGKEPTGYAKGDFLSIDELKGKAKKATKEADIFSKLKQTTGAKQPTGKSSIDKLKSMASKSKSDSTGKLKEIASRKRKKK